MMLSVENAHVKIGAIVALRGFSLSLGEGEMVGLTGRNGAGKTTFMKAVMGLHKLQQGGVSLDGRDLTKVAIHERAALGIGYMPEDRALIPDLTVEENILLPTWVTKSLDGPARLETVYEILPELKEMRARKALLLSGGQQKLVALARALAVGTRLLLLDEPFEGVAPALSQRLADVIGGLRGHNMAVILSQSELNHSFDIFDREFVIERGANMAAKENA
ncbi:ATP-binding cassette domain-containing protein [Marivibrio halodurans]|uniref:ATP-binding cassette domain-containing protein n=1 Tax=Marivibrio halodurans TaxID=2039722 RepID=A0A8J7V261_9PROT|nr:ATP-binding cassette domain-containing protein [Marivibrio halodurans]MBP5855424.1 ATP-binding cassette domain-containing protein [Marivibrio halodurans]